MHFFYESYLHWKNAQNNPLFLPIVSGVEFKVKQLPCAVQITENTRFEFVASLTKEYLQ